MVARRLMRSSDVRIEQQRASTARGLRSPRHNFFAQDGAAIVGTLVPMTIAPVLAGDTVKSLSYMARIMCGTAQQSDAVSVIGSWFESWVFYVRIGDMPNAEAIRDMLVGGSPTTVEWLDECMSAIWTGFFQDERNATIWNPAANNWLRLPSSGWWDSAVNAASLPDPEPGGDGSEWETQWARYEAMRRAKLTTQTFEEYLAMQGVAVPPQLRQEHDPELKVPELLHYAREFAYPQATGSVDDNGKETYRTSWFIQEKLARSRFCAEPGFIVTCCAIRPKTYRATTFNPLDVLDDATGWLPIEFDTDPHTSLVEVPGSVFGDTTPGAAAVVDVRDLFLHGAERLSGVSPTGAVQPLTYAPFYSGASLQGFMVDATVTHAISSRVSRDTTA